MLFTDARRFGRYLAIIAVGVPVWYIVGILFTLAPELGTALGLPEKPSPATALFLVYGGGTIGDVAVRPPQPVAALAPRRDRDLGSPAGSAS